jgi:6,7-dimethyl-8-ribityllumazine synthase
MHQAERREFKKFDASSYKVGIVVAQFNSEITDQLLDNAIEVLGQYKISKENLNIIRVAGCVEIPLVLKKLAESENYNCLIALGAVIRGETSHFDYVAKIVSEGMLRVSLDHGIPIGFGILTTDNQKQAQERVDAGGGAAEAALQSVNIGNQSNITIC